MNIVLILSADRLSGFKSTGKALRNSGFSAEFFLTVIISIVAKLKP